MDLCVHQQFLCQHLSCWVWTTLMGIQMSQFHPKQCWGGTDGLWLCQDAGLRHLEWRVTAGHWAPGAVPVCRLARMPRWDVQMGCCSGVPGGDVLWSLSSLHKEGKSYGQAAPTHP